MHLLALQPGRIDDGGTAVDLGQTPGEIVVLTSADSEIAGLAAAQGRLGAGAPASLRIANLVQLAHPMSVDTYVEATLSRAKIAIVRLLGGRAYWAYGVEEAARAARTAGLALALLPGDDRPDCELEALSTISTSAYRDLWAYFSEGGVDNLSRALLYCGHLLGRGPMPERARPLLPAGLYWPGLAEPALADVKARWHARSRPACALTFYRALVQSGQTAVIDCLIEEISTAGLNPLPIFALSFKDDAAAAIAGRLLESVNPALVVNCTSFALGTPGTLAATTLLDGGARPVIQAILASLDRTAWEASPRGLGPRDIAMNVALPEIDGRIVSRAVGFKAATAFDETTQARIVAHAPDRERVRFVAGLAAAHVRLAATRAGDQKIAIVLANYPNRDGRIGNGVGLDTPQSVAGLVGALAAAGYDTRGAPRTGAGLMTHLLTGPTNAGRKPGFASGARLALDDYLPAFERLPACLANALTERWGAPEADPFFADGGFNLPLHRFGNLAIGIQPARGYNIDPRATYHDPALVPPHGYLAFHVWLREAFGVQAIVQAGKHGNLEWLPGKAVGLGAECWPDAVLGPLPVVYPFIVNDPGEGTQAKRRSAAVIVDHLTPPLARAETYGALKDLEALVDEYFDASQVDSRRAGHVARRIIEHARQSGLDADCGIAPQDDEAAALAKLDAHLCDLKELQIRDGLHVLGTAPDGARLTALLVALARVPRGSGGGRDASLIGALADDLGLGFDPLDCDLAQPWAGPRPEILVGSVKDAWRSHGDTLERLESLAARLVEGTQGAPHDWRATRLVLGEIETRLRPAIAESADAETRAVLTALSGRFVTPGPSGAPSRGRPDVLPTGRNFYSVDTRAVPTEAAFALGEKSAALLVEDYRQRSGAWPRHMAISAWGTANMRTGGDDLAQALALIGARPRWERASGRVAGFDIVPLAALGRPRVDVTLRVSGFFRDAFPAQIDLFDSAVRAIARLDEPAADNPIAERVSADTARLIGDGLTPENAGRQAGYRVFSSMPGAYGAGLQALIDEGIWETRGDLAGAYMGWSAFAYGHGAEGERAPELLAQRLSRVEAVIHNQDNREHDLLDSDDYYQFEGGLAAAVEAARGERPVIYHNDHSRPARPVVRTLEEEIARVVRGRAANPKWIEGVMRHGYKGASEIAATVDYLFAFQATTGAVRDHHFDLLFDAYLGDATVRDFIAKANAPALFEIAARFSQALARGLWHPRSNSVYDDLARIAKGLS